MGRESRDGERQTDKVSCKKQKFFEPIPIPLSVTSSLFQAVGAVGWGAFWAAAPMEMLARGGIIWLPLLKTSRRGGIQSIDKFSNNSGSDTP